MSDQKKLKPITKNQKLINPMGLCAPLDDYYLHIWINPPNLYHQTLMPLLSTTVTCATKYFKTPMKQTVPCDVYKLMYVEWRTNQLVVPPKIARDQQNFTLWSLGWISCTNLNRSSKLWLPNLDDNYFLITVCSLPVPGQTHTNKQSLNQQEMFN